MRAIEWRVESVASQMLEGRRFATEVESEDLEALLPQERKSRADERVSEAIFQVIFKVMLSKYSRYFKYQLFKVLLL